MRLNKYQFLSLLLILSIGCNKQKSVTNLNEDTMELLVGTYTGNGSEGIYRFQFDSKSGTLTNQELLVKTSNPSYLAISNDRQFVYSVNENEVGAVSSFKWNKDKSQLDSVSQSPTEGMHPCYISLNNSEKVLAVANYSSGNVSVFNVNKDGIISTPQIMQHSGTGPNSERQEGPHAHCSIFEGDEWLYAVDLGIDQIIAYPSGEELLGNPHIALQLEPGDGPRHLVFHPTEPLAFIINELSNTVVSLKVDKINGQFESIERVSTLPDDFVGHSQSADIQISPDGKFLYASNRGHESIAIISVSKEGALRRIGTESVQGEWPRNFVLTPNGGHLLVANQYTNNIVVFEVDKVTGLLSYTGNQAEISSPVCLKF